MLQNCPECGLQVSSSAIACPHCGYPLKIHKPSTYHRPAKRRRLPNGFGQISEMKGHNLRKPFRAMITVGKTTTGRPICRALKPEAYFSTYNEAYEALIQYHKNPYKFESTITMNELFQNFASTKEKSDNKKYIVNQKRWWMYLTSIHDIQVSNIRVVHIKDAINNAEIVEEGGITKASTEVKHRAKTLLNTLLDYAMECGIVEHNYARDCKNIGIEYETSEDAHIAFTFDELDILWRNLYNVPCVDIVIINCYTGWRPNELCKMKLEDIDIENWIMRGGSKTEAGRNRIVPIHPAVRSIVLKKYNYAKSIGSPYFLLEEETKKRVNYNIFYLRVKSICEDLHFNVLHKPHDCRKTFVTMAKYYNMNEYAIKRIVGHRIKDLTERVYTDRPIDWFQEEVAKIQYPQKSI